MSACDCCAAARSAVLLRAFDATATRWQARLCTHCLGWLHDVVSAARDDSPRLIASPTVNGRDLVFDDQCRLCRRISGEPLASVECRVSGGGRVPFPNLRLCVPCDAWLASIARDGRSPRSLRARDIDGGYGNWLHPNLRALTAAVDISDAAARATVLQSCGSMDIAAGQPDAVASPSVLFLEVPARVRRRTPANPAPVPLVLLAPHTARHDLLAALSPDVVDWLTLPVTPQQVAAALTRVLLFRGRPRDWDGRLALPVLHPVEPMPPTLLVRPLRGVDPFEVVWLLRRFARGYDDLGALGGEIVLVPRVPVRRLDTVARRLATLLGGRVSIETLALPSHAPRLHASA